MFLDSPEAVSKKISEANSGGGSRTKNGVLASLRDILIPISKLRLDRLRSTAGMDPAEIQGIQQPFCSEGAPDGTVFTVEVEGGNGHEYKHYKSFDEIERDLGENKLSTDALNVAIAGAFNRLLEPIRKTFEESEEWQAVDKLAYPEPAWENQRKDLPI